MTKIISVFNHKGGVGKSTSVSSIGAGLVEHGKKVLLIDLDPQSNLTTSFLQEEPERTIYEAFIDGKNLPVVEISSLLHIVPSSLEHSATEIAISTKMQREAILKKLIAPIADNYDYILLDCPPSLGLISINALVASNEVYVPITAEILPTRGLRMLTDIIGQVQEGLNPDLYIGGIILTRWENSNLSRDIEASLRETFGDVVFKTKIRKNISIAEAPSTFQSILQYAPDSNGAKDYRALTKEIITKEEA